MIGRFNKLSSVMVVACALAAGMACAEEPSLALDSLSGDYQLRYTDEEGKLVEVTLVPPTKVKPVFSSQFLAQTNGDTRYLYQVAVETTSPQRLLDMRLGVSGARMSLVMIDRVERKLGRPTATPAGWTGTIDKPAPVNFLTQTTSAGEQVDWGMQEPDRTISANTGLAAGQKASGFVLDSGDLPGIVVAELRGNTGPVIGYSIEILGGTPTDEEIARKIDLAYVPRFAAAPRITVSTPWSPGETIFALQDHVRKWGSAYPDSTGQLDEAVLGEIENWFSVIIGAVNRGDQQSTLNGINGLLGYIRTTQNKYKPADLSKIPHEGVAKATPQWPITNLAARVLTYDLGYILNRLKKEPLIPVLERY